MNSAARVMKQGISDLRFTIEKTTVQHQGHEGSTMAREGRIGRGVSAVRYTTNFRPYCSVVVEWAERY